MSRGYDLLAPIYNFCSWLPGAGSIHRLQRGAGQHMRCGDRLWVFGGGSGGALRSWSQAGPSSIRYVELSRGMLSRARKRVPGKIEVVFEEGGFERIPLAGPFDCCLLPFVLDQYDEIEIEQVARSLSEAAGPGARVIVQDFTWAELQGCSARAQQLFVRGLYRSFQPLCGFSRRQMPRIGQAFAGAGFVPVFERRVLGGWLQESVFVRRRPAEG